MGYSSKYALLFFISIYISQITGAVIRLSPSDCDQQPSAPIKTSQLPSSSGVSTAQYTPQRGNPPAFGGLTESQAYGYLGNTLKALARAGRLRTVSESEKRLNAQRLTRCKNLDDFARLPRYVQISADGIKKREALKFAGEFRKLRQASPQIYKAVKKKLKENREQEKRDAWERAGQEAEKLKRLAAQARKEQAEIADQSEEIESRALPNSTPQLDVAPSGSRRIDSMRDTISVQHDLNGNLRDSYNSWNLEHELRMVMAGYKPEIRSSQTKPNPRAASSELPKKERAKPASTSESRDFTDYQEFREQALQQYLHSLTPDQLGGLFVSAQLQDAQANYQQKWPTIKHDAELAKAHLDEPEAQKFVTLVQEQHALRKKIAAIHGTYNKILSWRAAGHEVSKLVLEKIENLITQRTLDFYEIANKVCSAHQEYLNAQKYKISFRKKIANGFGWIYSGIFGSSDTNAKTARPTGGGTTSPERKAATEDSEKIKKEKAESKRAVSALSLEEDKPLFAKAQSAEPKKSVFPASLKNLSQQAHEYITKLNIIDLDKLKVQNKDSQEELIEVVNSIVAVCEQLEHESKVTPGQDIIKSAESRILLEQLHAVLCLTPIIADLNNAGKYPQAFELVKAIHNILDFVQGGARHLGHEAWQTVKNIPLDVAAVAVVSHIPRMACIPVMVTMGLYNACSCYPELKEHVIQMYDFLILGDFQKAGESAAKIGINLVHANKLFHDFHALCKGLGKAGYKNLFSNSIKHGIAECEKISAAKKEVDELFAEIHAYSDYQKLTEMAVKLDIPKEAFYKMTRDACGMVKTPKDVCDLLSQIQKCWGFKSNCIPKGLSKPLSYDIAHFVLLEKHNGNRIGGFHIDLGGKIQKNGRLEFLKIKEGPNSESYCALIKCPITGRAKPCSFFKSDRDALTHLQWVDSIISKIDYNEIPKAGIERIQVTKSIGDNGYKLIANINYTTCEVISFYIEHPCWKNAFGKEKN